MVNHTNVFLLGLHQQELVFTTVTVFDTTPPYVEKVTISTKGQLNYNNVMININIKLYH